MRKAIIFTYGAIAYTIFLGVFLYLVGFVGGFVTPTALDGEVTTPFGDALIINIALVGLFGMQHSVMARPAFKRVWTRVVTKEAERSTYVMMTNIVLAIMFWQWRPMEGAVWQITHPVGEIAAWTIYGLGWLTVLATTFMINHFDLFGLRQIWLQLRDKPYTHLRFGRPLIYKFIRHPLYVGWFLTFWATPNMTISHLVYALGMTGYILAAIPYEEQDLVDHLGDDYTTYMKEVPRFVPRVTRVATTENLEKVTAE